MRPIITLTAAALLLSLSVTVRAQQQPPPTDDLQIPLDTTGVSDWSYLNPAAVKPVASFGVRFHNTTSDRTFIVTMPFVFGKDEFASAFATARFRRGGLTLADVVCRALVPDYGKDGVVCNLGPDDPSTKGSAEARVFYTDTLDRIEELRTLIQAITAATTAPTAEACAATPNAAPCLIERLYWQAACDLCGETQTQLDDPRAALTDHLSHRAEALIQQLMHVRPGEPAITLPDQSTCPMVSTVLLDKKLIALTDEPGVPDCSRTISAAKPGGALDASLYEAGDAAALDQFARDRFALARQPLLAAAKRELNDTLDMPRIRAIRNTLQARYDEARAQRNGNRYADTIEMAAKLLKSYTADSPVPFPWTERRARYKENSRREVTTVGDFGVSIECQGESTDCTASATIPPNQTVRFSNATLRHNPKQLVRFKVSFFGRTAPPPNATAYVSLGETQESIPSEFAVGLGIDGATAYDLPKDFIGHDRHTSGNGTASVEFGGGIVDGSVSLVFKNGDFGGPASTRTVNLDEYQAKVFGPRQLTLQYGQFPFARPSSGIAVSETGEGVLLAYRKLTGSYILHRESDEPNENISTQDDDYYVTILQMKNLSPPLMGIDGVDVIAVYGNNKNDDRPKPGPDGAIPPRKAAYTFLTLGSEIRTSFDFLGNGSAALAAYHSERHVNPRREESEELVKGRGTVGLLTIGWQWSGSKTLFEQSSKGRPSYGPTFTIGRGSGDNAETADRNEGYLGENAGFANDKIFLAQISKHKDEIGRGLKNKWYAGAQWNDARGSLLGWLAGIIGDPKSIVSATTNIALHTYRFTHALQGHHDGGMEADLEFLVESPASVTWSLGGAYYRRSDAVKLVGLAKDLWQITGGVSVKLQGH